MMMKIPEFTPRAENRTTLAKLALALIHDHPRASDLELVRRWVACVRGDDDLLNACLQQQANRALVISL